MPSLPSDLRRVLENAVIAARDEATSAASAALKRFGVAAKEVPTYLTPAERALRLKLRAAARQLGDPWTAEKQTFTSLIKLTHEIAYEHWHRMLFARFLAENNLLLHPEHGVHVDLATVADLAQEEAARTGAKSDTWALAGRFAAKMLPHIFRPDDPALAVQLAPEHQQALEKLLEQLPPSLFTADDALGWVYQFWQSAEKDRVNRAGDKITGETLPAVTQLFTEHYMVLFLLHNTVGAWWAGRRIADLGLRIADCKTEQECRDAVALPGYNFEYLRFVQAGAASSQSEIHNPQSAIPWRPAAGTFDGWPKMAKELRVLDPCCGSGHFLVAVLELLIHLRMAEEGLSLREAARAVIADNLFGLELDPRCTQIAAFNVALAAWKLTCEYFPIPQMHIACSGLSPNCTKEQWLQLADARLSAGPRAASSSRAALNRGAIRNTLMDLHELFTQAPELGSLIDPAATAGTLGSADWETVKPFLDEALAQESGADDDAHERTVAAQGMVKAAEILAGDYTLVITNVPYLGRGKQNETLQKWADKNEPDAKADLATIFISRAFKWLCIGSSFAVVSPQNWLFLTTYTKLRQRFLRDETWNVVARLGPGAFDTIGGAVVNVALLTLSSGKPKDGHGMLGLNASTYKTPPEKASLLRGDIGNDSHQLSQAGQLKNPDARITTRDHEETALLSALAETGTGQQSFDSERFWFSFWEVTLLDNSWVAAQSTVGETECFAGRSLSLRWQNGTGDLFELMQMKEAEGYSSGIWRAGTQFWNKRGVLVSLAGEIKACIYDGVSFDNNTGVIIPKRESHLAAIWSFCSSEAFVESVRQIDQKLNVTNSTLAKVPFDLAHWQTVAAQMYPNGLPEPESDDPTQWLFHGRPEASEQPLQVAIARLVGYRWPAEMEDAAGSLTLAPAMSNNGEEPFDQLLPEPAKEPHKRIRLSQRARELVARCEELLPFADDDGVVPLVAINTEKPGEQRLRELLGAAWAGGTPAHHNTGETPVPHLSLNDLLAAAGSPGRSLDEWLKHEFFAQHCGLFHHRPFVWQIWDGKKDGFNILVHYHRLAAANGEGNKLLQKITYTYLGDWIAQQQAASKRGEAGADLRLKAAQDLQKKLEAILAGEPPLDIFVRWKPLHEQPIGWNPDLNDGVRMNIRPFVTAGVLRARVNVKWKKDRGKEPQASRPREQFPWFWSCPEESPPTDFPGGDKFTGDRLNDLHYTNRVKQAARNLAQSITAKVR